MSDFSFFQIDFWDSSHLCYLFLDMLSTVSVTRSVEYRNKDTKAEHQKGKTGGKAQVEIID